MHTKLLFGKLVFANTEEKSVFFLNLTRWKRVWKGKILQSYFPSYLFWRNNLKIYMQETVCSKHFILYLIINLCGGIDFWIMPWSSGYNEFCCNFYFFFSCYSTTKKSNISDNFNIFLCVAVLPHFYHVCRQYYILKFSISY